MNLIVPGPLAGERLDRVVALATGMTRAGAAALVDAGGVSVAGRAVTTRSRRVVEGDVVDIEVPDGPASGPSADPGVAFAVVWSDAAAIVVDKPAGLVVHPGSGTPAGTLVNGLLARFPDMATQGWAEPERAGIVHRLDKGTSGLLVVARTVDALAALGAQLRARTFGRGYLALVWGTVEAPSGVVDAPVGRSVRDPVRMAVRADGRRAVTRYEVVARYGGPTPVTLLACRLETGRTHQIRVHLAAIGHPVVGDARYGPGRTAAFDPGRPFLHAAHLAFDHPVTGERRSFDSPLPPDLEEVRIGLAALDRDA